MLSRASLRCLEVCGQCLGKLDPAIAARAKDVHVGRLRKILAPVKENTLGQCTMLFISADVSARHHICVMLGNFIGMVM